MVNDINDMVRINANIRVGLTNYREMQYYGPLYLGSRRQELKFIYDTGSSWLWVPKTNCDGCPTNKRYDTTKSVTYNETSDLYELFYGKGHVVGNLAYDRVALMRMEVKSVNMKMLTISAAEDLQGTQADGILGLSPEPKSGAQSLVTTLAKEGVIDAAQFTVYIGSTQETSYVEFGRYKGNTENVTWVQLTDTSYWRVYLDDMTYKELPIELTSTKAVLDTGSSILGFPTHDLQSIIFAIKEDRQLYYLEDIGFYGVRCKSPDEFYDLKIDINGHITRISPEDYILKVNEYCIFFLFDLGSSMNFVLLGDSYLKGNLVIHDVENKRVGLFPQVYAYPKRDYEADVAAGTVVIVGVAVILGLGA